MADVLSFNDTCTLVSKKLVRRDKLGNKKYDTEENEVFCNVTSVGRGQFFSASVRGYKLSYVITINEFEYDGEAKIVFNDKTYDVIRTYLLENGLLEITVGEKVGDVS